MTRILFPRLFLLCVALGFAVTVTAQSSEAELQNASSANATKLENSPTVDQQRARAIGPDSTLIKVPALPASPFDKQLLTAIESHLGATYHYTSTGPYSFDCSGFVWRTYQEAGIDFTRGPARSYWAVFAAPPKEEQFKFGTLVFFSRLRHVGIVADDKGFYHSSRHHGVVYSRFNDYWLSRIDGFRRVPLNAVSTAVRVVPSKSSNPLVFGEH